MVVSIIFVDIFKKCMVKAKIMQELEEEFTPDIGEIDYFSAIPVKLRKAWLAEELSMKNNLGI